MVKSNKRRDEERRSAAAVKVAQMQLRQRAAERRRRSITVSAVAVAVIVVIVGAFVLVESHNSAPKVAAGTVGGSTADYGFVVGKADAPATMVAYEDFQCPVCRQFETTDASTIESYITSGKLKVEFRPIAILDRDSSTEYSTRSLNAAACVRNFSTPGDFKIFHDLLYKNQPPEGSAGLTDAQLIAYANQAIRSTKPAVATCITDQTYRDWTASATDAASRAGVTGTPTVTVGGQNISLDTLSSTADLIKILDAAVAKGSKTSKTK